MPQFAIYRRSFSYVGQTGLLAAIYFTVAKISLLLAIPPGYAAAVWPPSGLAVAAILLAGSRMWPGIWLGAALANLTVQSSIGTAVLIGTGNALEALVAAALILKFIGLPRRFERGEDVFKFVAAAVVASTVAATIGVSGIALTGTMTAVDFADNWRTWWQGDVAGIIVVAPLLLFWTAAPSMSTSKKFEATAFALVLAIAGYIVFGSGMSLMGFSPALLLLTFPLIIWAALRFDQLEVAAAINALCAIAIVYTIVGRGPFVAPSVNASLLLLLAFVSIVAITGLVLSAVVGQYRRATMALRQAHDELELRVSVRTHELGEANRSLQRDIAVRSRIEEDLKRSEEKFRLLVEGIRDYAIFMLDPEGRVASWNAGAESIKGYRADEIIGQHFSRFYPPDAIASRFPHRELEVAAHTGRFEDEGWRVRKDGTTFWANVTITALFDPNRKLRGFAKVTRDMTQRRRVEALEHSERRMSEFLAMLGHELRNPLAPIRNAIDVMRLRADDPAAQEWARSVIDRQLIQLTRLVDDLLDVGRISSGKIVLHREPIELNAAVQRAVEASRPVADASGHTLVVRLSSEPLAVDGDLTRLSQAVLNLLTNAIKYTPSGGRITVEAAREGNMAAVRVRDTGIGMSAELIPNVFDLFVQGERSLDRSEGGLGVGLTLVNRLVTLHGGTVSAYSEGRGRGSEFVIRLPALAEAPLPREVVAAREAASATHRRRVLVVDDNRDSADTLAALLEAWGHEVRTFYDGPSALEGATEFEPDVVLLDIGLPKMSGYEVAGHLRQSANRSMILVAFTGYGQDEDRRRVREAGFDYHLVKPLEVAALERILDSVVTAAAPGLPSEGGATG
ncbi:MAG TPA: MASE1 domain-containing protein [Casimicrobiaceae bacterium]